MNTKYKKLENIIKKYKRVIIAYSGGCDSSLLLYVCAKFLEAKNVLAVTAKSSTYPDWELKDALKFTKMYSIPHKIIVSEELDSRGFQKNNENRCFYCKDELFSKLNTIAKKKKYDAVFDGSNFDDLKDFRPGAKAKKKHNILSPLQDARFTKNDIRKLSKKFNLFTADKSAFACFTSRFPYYIPLTKEKFDKIQKAEKYLKKFALKQLRVRYHNDIARIEVLEEDFKKILQNRKKIINYFKKIGFKYTALDLQGYITGSMNKTIKK